MDINELLRKVNTSMDNLDLITARRVIEDNIDLLNENRHHLKSNARSLLDILKNSTSSEFSTLNRSEMNILNSINLSASKFDVRGLKLTIKNNPELFIRKDLMHYLNEDAKTLLIGMNAISSVE